MQTKIGMKVRIKVTPRAAAKDVSGAEVHILDAGHFVLDEQSREVIRLTETFMRKQLPQ